MQASHDTTSMLEDITWCSHTTTSDLIRFLVWAGRLG